MEIVCTIRFVIWQISPYMNNIANQHGVFSPKPLLNILG